jgi:hypothetical protein
MTSSISTEGKIVLGVGQLRPGIRRGDAGNVTRSYRPATTTTAPIEKYQRMAASRGSRGS